MAEIIYTQIKELDPRAETSFDALPDDLNIPLQGDNETEGKRVQVGAFKQALTDNKQAVQAALDTQTDNINKALAEQTAQVNADVAAKLAAQSQDIDTMLSGFSEDMDEKITAQDARVKSYTDAAAQSASEAAASQSAAAASQKAAATSQTAAKTSEANAAASEDSAAASQQAAAASQSAAKASETNAATSAGTASTKASEAATSASAAGSSASAAKASETNAKASETAAAAAAANVERHDRDFGYYGEAGTIALSVAQSGKYINTSGAEVANTSYAISAPVSVKRGSIYLIKASSAVSTSVALVSRMVSTEYTALIIYDYTYDEQGRVLTATAQYDKTLVYTYSYDDEGNATITDKDGGEVESLPATREVVENTYEPLFRAASGKMPLSGYYVFACTEDMDVYISNREPDMATPMIEVSYGVLTSFMTSIGNLQAQVDAIEESTMPQAESAYQSVEGIAAAMQGAVPDYPSVPLLCGQPAKLFGAGAPSSDVVPVNWKQYDEGGYNWNGMPTALGQEYFDTSADTGGHYIAVPAEPSYTSVGIQHNVSELRWMNV